MFLNLRTLSFIISLLHYFASEYYTIGICIQISAVLFSDPLDKQTKALYLCENYIGGGGWSVAFVWRSLCEIV